MLRKAFSLNELNKLAESRMSNYNLFNWLTCLILTSLAISSNGRPDPYTCMEGKEFPPGIRYVLLDLSELYKRPRVHLAWRVIPENSGDVLLIAEWALKKKFRIATYEPGYNYVSPLFINLQEELGSPNKANICPTDVYVDYTVHLNTISIISNSRKPHSPLVIVEPGATLVELLTALEKKDLGLLGHPPTGNITIGSILATGGHGTGIPDKNVPGNTGTLSNQLIAITVARWDERRKQYMNTEYSLEYNLEEFGALKMHLGRMLVTNYALRVTKLVNLRCLSRVDISSSTLFATPGNINSIDNELHLSSFLDDFGALEVTWYPFNKLPHLRLWKSSPQRPLISLPINETYPYPNLHEPELLRMEEKINKGQLKYIPVYANLQQTIAASRVRSFMSEDIWGPSKNVLLYALPNSTQIHSSGHVIITTISEVQKILNQFTRLYEKRILSSNTPTDFQITGALQIRITGLDQDIRRPPEEAPLLSPIRAIPGYNVGIWINSNSLLNTPNFGKFGQALEAQLKEMVDSKKFKMLVRPEWSRGFAYDSEGAWGNRQYMVDSVTSGIGLNKWKQAYDVFNKIDPNKLFGTEFLKKLLELPLIKTSSTLNNVTRTTAPSLKYTGKMTSEIPTTDTTATSSSTKATTEAEATTLNPVTMGTSVRHEQTTEPVTTLPSSTEPATISSSVIGTATTKLGSITYPTTVAAAVDETTETAIQGITNPNILPQHRSQDRNAQKVCHEI